MFTKNFAVVVDCTLAAGVVPLLSTIPPRADTPQAERRVLELNDVIRGLAASRRVPLMDLYAAVMLLPHHGLNPDGIHLRADFTNAAPHGCWLTRESLANGMNMRNLVTLTALDRARRFLVEVKRRRPRGEGRSAS